jgi:hypothetical protein
MWQTDAVGLRVTLASSLVFFHRGSYNNNSHESYLTAHYRLHSGERLFSYYVCNKSVSSIL